MTIADAIECLCRAGGRAHVDGLSYELEEDGRWLVSVDSVPGAMAYGATKEEAANAATRIAFDETATRAALGENVK